MTITEKKNQEQLNKIKERYEMVTGNTVLDIECRDGKEVDEEWEIFMKLKKDNGLFKENQKEEINAVFPAFTKECVLVLMLQEMYKIR